MMYVITTIIIFWIWTIWHLVHAKNIMIRIKEDGTIWEVESINDESEKVIVVCTEKYYEYYQNKYSGGNDSPESVNNEYSFDQIEFI